MLTNHTVESLTIVYKGHVHFFICISDIYFAMLNDEKHVCCTSICSLSNLTVGYFKLNFLLHSIEDNIQKNFTCVRYQGYGYVVFTVFDVATFVKHDTFLCFPVRGPFVSFPYWCKVGNAFTLASPLNFKSSAWKLSSPGNFPGFRLFLMQLSILL